MPWDLWFPCWPTAGVAGERRHCRCAASAASQQVTVRPVSTIGDGDTEFIGQRGGHLANDGSVPTADEHRDHRTDIGLEPGVDTPLDAAQKSLGRRHVLLARK